MYLNIGNNLQGDGCKIEGIHHKVHEIPPVMDVILKSTIPHLLDLRPYESCKGGQDILGTNTFMVLWSKMNDENFAWRTLQANSSIYD